MWESGSRVVGRNNRFADDIVVLMAGSVSFGIVLLVATCVLSLVTPHRGLWVTLAVSVLLISGPLAILWRMDR